MGMKCIGCDKEMGFEGAGTLSITCECGARMFYNEGFSKMLFPLSVIEASIHGKPLPHLNFLVGESTFMSPAKEGCTAALRDMGSIWIHECEECQTSGRFCKAS